MMTRHTLGFAHMLFLCVTSLTTAVAPGFGKVRYDDIPWQGLEVLLDRKHALPGDTVTVRIASHGPADPVPPAVFLLTPTRGIRPLGVRANRSKPTEFVGTIVLARDATEGIYGITAIGSYGHKQVLGKAAFLSGKVVMDFAIMSSFSSPGTVSDMARYIDEFRKASGNALTLHATMSTETVNGGTPRIRALWASKVCKRAVSAADDRIEMMLRLADSSGLPSIISVTWDATDTELPTTDYMKSITTLSEELWSMYGHHPSLVGFYSYQEGSGTYFANYVREFCRGVKQLNPGLLTMCAPYIDDPLLAGYLAAIDELDIVNYQASIMTSYRPDNRKLYPNRRIKDVTSLSAGATRVRDKITLSHVEFMGYGENRVADSYLTRYENIFNQFPSVASSYGPDGITFFTYSSCIYYNAKSLPHEAQRAARAVADGMKAYALISHEIADQSSHIAIYIPYSDWCIERWASSITPATDALCRLGISPDIVPFVPPRGEDLLPYYPMKMNPEQLNFLLRNKYVLLLPDISGMQETDSELLETFVRRGGVAIAFGPHIPYGDRFDRTTLWGAEESTPLQAGKQFKRMRIMRPPGTRTTQGITYDFAPLVATSWRPSADMRIADFTDGSGAIFSHRYHDGKAYVVSLSVQAAVESFPDLMRDLLDDALGTYNLQRPFDVYGMNDRMDVAMSRREGRYYLMVANYGPAAVSLSISPLSLDRTTEYLMRDLKTSTISTTIAAHTTAPLDVEVDGNNFIAISLVPRNQVAK